MEFKEIEKQHKEFNRRMDKLVIESMARTKVIEKEMKELQKKANKNILELSRLL